MIRLPHLASTRAVTVVAVLLVGALVLMVIVGNVQLLQGDSYKALYDGRWIAHHGIPHTEAFSVAARRRWIDEEWLAELIFYELWTIGGYALVAIVSALSITAAYMILAALLRGRGTPVVWTVLFSLAALLAYSEWAFVRARDFVLPLSALLLLICLSDNKRKRPTWRLLFLIPILVLWANLHGSVLLGAALAATYLAYRAATAAKMGHRRDAAGCLALAVGVALTPLANPYGIGIIDYYREFVGNAPMRLAAPEWASPRLLSGSFVEIFVPLVLAGVLVVRAARRHERMSPVVLGAVAITAVAAILAVGNVVWLGMTLAVLFGDLSRPWRWSREPSRRVAYGLIALGAIGFTLVVLSLGIRNSRAYEGITAIRAIDSADVYASKHPCELILADNWDASALLWRDPRLAGRIGFDARYEQFPPAVLMRWITFESGSPYDWSHAIGSYQILIGDSAFSSILVQRLERLRATRVLERDRAGVAVVRLLSRGSCWRSRRIANHISRQGSVA